MSEESVTHPLELDDEQEIEEGQGKKSPLILVGFVLAIVLGLGAITGAVYFGYTKFSGEGEATIEVRDDFDGGNIPMESEPPKPTVVQSFGVETTPTLPVEIPMIPGASEIEIEPPQKDDQPNIDTSELYVRINKIDNDINDLTTKLNNLTASINALVSISKSVSDISSESYGLVQLTKANTDALMASTEEIAQKFNSTQVDVKTVRKTVVGEAERKKVLAEKPQFRISTPSIWGDEVKFVIEGGHGFYQVASQGDVVDSWELRSYDLRNRRVVFAKGGETYEMEYAD
ncbi:TPA: hypothetical protein I7682_17945 [Vibrio vulnificus]|nr:hypothetical protein [Vibrio vulnificus]